MPTEIAHLPLIEVLLRISLSFIAGIVLGFERERHGRAAGLRTTMLACVASCLAMLLSHYFAVEYAVSQDSSWRPDPGRLAAGILTGIGFLGAGTIVRQNGSVRGVTTAAVLWYATILGLIFGSGHHALGIIGWIIALCALFLLPRLDEHIESTQYAVVSVTMQLEGESEHLLRRHIENEGAKVENIRLSVDVELQQQTIRYYVKYKSSTVSEIPLDVVRALRAHPGVLRVRWH
jgi:putative Mg2+ transporter-C (MgtC) family protein